MATALRRGYATAATDTGHVSEGVFDATWAFGRPDLIEDFGHRGLHLTTVNAKAITAAHYGRPPDYSYYVGCSKGGQQGLMEAQRYPEDYDGLIAGNPAHDWTSFYAGAHLWYSLATLADPDSYIPADKLPLLGDAVNAACDALDGIEDGVLDDPRACDFDPAELDVRGGPGPGDLLHGEAGGGGCAPSGRARRTPPASAYTPDSCPGGEGTPGWDRWVSGEAPFTSLHWLAAEGFFRNLVFDDLDWDFRTFDYDEDLAFALDKVGAALDAVDPDLRPLRDRGGKLLVYHGWSDADISPLSSIEYYERRGRPSSGTVASDEAALTDTREFFRLFMAPGMGHCAGGPGPDRFDALTALEQWVEEGRAPERIVASRVRDGVGRPHASAVSLPGGRALERQRQHRRRRELHVRDAVRRRGRRQGTAVSVTARSARSCTVPGTPSRVFAPSSASSTAVSGNAWNWNDCFDPSASRYGVRPR